jgi:homoserine dehydrogenase
MKQINIGIVGIGTVGGGLVKLLHEKTEWYRQTQGLPIKLTRIADTRTDRFKDLPVGDAICTANADDILNDPEVSIVVELVGGTGFAKGLVLNALARKKHVITANKALIAQHGPEIFDAAQKSNVSVYFEASVGGGMPVIKTIREALVANNIFSVKTIINGTCNYILTQMTEKGQQFATVLNDAQKKGFAEANADLDVDGIDSAHKVAIMASIIHGGYVPYGKFYVEGIKDITKDDIAFGRDLGYAIKLLGIIRKGPDEKTIDVRVHPAMVHRNHVLATVSDVFNAVLLDGHATGPILIYGRGAGEMPTASAVMSDIADAARDIVTSASRRIPMNYYHTDKVLTIKPIGEIVSRYYLCFYVTDKPKVLAGIASILGNHEISIASVMQKESKEDSTSVPVVFLTHKAVEKNMQEALDEISKTDFIKKKTRLIRIAGQDYWKTDDQRAR